MPEHLSTLLQPKPQAESSEKESPQRLSRSPHPYRRQRFEISNAAESLSTSGLSSHAPQRSIENADQDNRGGLQPVADTYPESTYSDSGTEADDEHFLKGLPAPKLRLHKGLRGADGQLSATPSPLLSPLLLSDDNGKSPNRKSPAASLNNLFSDDEFLKNATKIQEKRRVEVIRRSTETALLIFSGGVICLNPEIRSVMIIWRRELLCQFITMTSLVVLYPIRIFYHSRSQNYSGSISSFLIPPAFDPAPILYPPAITMLVSLVLSLDQPACILPSIILAISSLPKQVIPVIADMEGFYIIHWFCSCLPVFISTFSVSNNSSLLRFGWDPEVLTLIYPLHSALCATLRYLTTTSLLSAELQLLSAGVINLLLLASSPQAKILNILLWGGGAGLLVTCTRVLSWGVALARVPRWRFRRAEIRQEKLFSRRIGSRSIILSILGGEVQGNDSSDDNSMSRLPLRRRAASVSKAVQPVSGSSEQRVQTFPQENENTQDLSRLMQSTQRKRSSTIPTSTYPERVSSEGGRTSRKNKAKLLGIRSFSHLTQSQATRRKWLYAGYVYFCVLIIILGGIRAYVQSDVLRGQEPVGWALGYMLGDSQWFRMEVITNRLQEWICLPPRSGLEHMESCHKGWVQHLRHASFGEANTRLIISGYWLGVIIVGLAVVFRLSAIYEVDTRRKVFHFMMVAMLLPTTFVDPAYIALALILMLAIFLLLDLFRASQLPPLSKALASFLAPYVDGRDLKGPVVISHIFLLVGCAIPLWLSLGTLPRAGEGSLSGWEVPTREVSMVSGVICVGLGDAAASLIGRRFGRHKWLWGGGKSIEGSIAFATAVGLALIVAKGWLRFGGWPSNNDDVWTITIGKASVAACVASLTEAVLTGGNDNVIVPIILWLSVKGLDV